MPSALHEQPNAFKHQLSVGFTKVAKVTTRYGGAAPPRQHYLVNCKAKRRSRAGEKSFKARPRRVQFRPCRICRLGREAGREGIFARQILSCKHVLGVARG